MITKKNIFSILTISFLIFSSCTEDVIDVEAPQNYTFTRNGESTVNFVDETIFIAMSEELSEALLIETNTEAVLNAMFTHVQGASDFSDEGLNGSGLNVRNKIATSVDFYSTNTNTATTIRLEFDDWISEQVTDVFPNISTTASEGIAGSLTDSNGNVRYLNAKGVEINEVFTKALIGGFMVDQMLNNFLSSSVLDTDNNVQDNDDSILEGNTNYTVMEHKWDEAYGLLYGKEEDQTNPMYGIDGEGADSFLNRAVSLVNQDEDFAGIADAIFDAFKLGRAGIVAKDYDVREEQTEIIKEKISQVIAIRAVYCLQLAREILVTDPIDYATAFHQISEGLGFIYSLQFTREPNTTSSPTPYYTKTEVDAWFSDLLDTGNGLWQANTIAVLNTVSNEIIAEFDFTLLEAYDPLVD